VGRCDSEQRGGSGRRRPVARARRGDRRRVVRLTIGATWPAVRADRGRSRRPRVHRRRPRSRRCRVPHVAAGFGGSWHRDRGARHVARADGLAAARRSTFDGPVIGITGSVGKTSTKDLAWAALAASKRTWANERSFNNEQGLPTTLLNTPDDTEVLVLEMGMRGFGEIAELCAIARPTIGVVTRVAEAHSDRVGGIEGVARAKAELIEALPATVWRS
jgi:hypothetical protein